MIIKNGTIVTANDSYKADILIENRQIKAIGTAFDTADAQVINAADKYVMPGAIDVHTHIDLQAGQFHTSDDFFTGTRAAVCGGTTSVIEHLAFGPKNCSLRYQIDKYKKNADDKAVIDYGLHGVIQHVNDDVLKEMEQLAAEGISSFKIYMTYDFALDDASILRVLKKAKELNTVIAVHCENDAMINYWREKYTDEGKITPYYHALSRTDDSEAEAVERILNLAHIADDAPVYIVHLSTKKGLDIIRRARSNGQKNIYAETCPQYLILDEECYKRSDGLKYIMSPPLRKKEDITALWQGLADGSIDVVATDHCPFYWKTDKQAGINDFTKCPNGAPGIEERVVIMFSEGVMKNKITLNKYVELLCTKPARIYGMYPQKGALLPGSDANIMIIDPSENQKMNINNLHGTVDYTLYEGLNVKGKIVNVIRAGEIVYDGDFTADAGTGSFIERRVLK